LPLRCKEEVSWAEMKALQARMRAGKLPEVSYRIYRHSRPIDAQTIAQTELLDEVPQLSVFDERMIQTQWKGERIKNVRVASARVPRYCVRAKEELPVGTGAYVRTSDTTRPTCTRAISATSTSSPAPTPAAGAGRPPTPARWTSPPTMPEVQTRPGPEVQVDQHAAVGRGSRPGRAGQGRPPNHARLPGRERRAHPRRAEGRPDRHRPGRRAWPGHCQGRHHHPGQAPYRHPAIVAGRGRPCHK